MVQSSFALNAAAAAATAAGAAASGHKVMPERWGEEMADLDALFVFLSSVYGCFPFL